jgi:tetratricopeptide (TPR) repeat protein
MKLKTVLILILICVLAGGLPVTASNDDSFARGIDAFDAGRWAPAADLFRKAATEKPQDEVVRLTTGVALANVRRYPEAAEQFEWAVRIAPGGVIPLLLLDGTYSEMGNGVAARQARGKANAMITSGRAFGARQSSDRMLADSLMKYPRNAIAACLLGDSYQLQGKQELAKAQYSRSASLAPLWAKPVFNLGLSNLPTDAKSAEASFGRAIELDPSNSRAYLWLGDAYLKQKRTDKAVEAYTEASKDKALVAEAQTRIGNAQMQGGDYGLAQQNFEAAASNAPRDARPLAGQAQVYQSTGQYKQAETKYNEAGAVLTQNAAPPSSQAVVSKQVAEVQAAQGKLEDANQSFGVAYKLQPTYSNAVALAGAQMQTNALPESVASCEAALKKNPRDTPAMVYLLAAYKIQGNDQGRLEMARRLVKADPANAGTYYSEVGCVQMRLGDEKGALDAFAQAMDAGDSASWGVTARSARECGALEKLAQRYDRGYALSNNPRAGKALFELFSVQGDTARMVTTAEKLSRQAPDDVSVLLRLGEAYERAGRVNDALAVYARVASGPDAAASSAARGRIGVLKGGK